MYREKVEIEKAANTIRKIRKMMKASLRTLTIQTTTGPRDLLKRNHLRGLRRDRLAPMANNVQLTLTGWFPVKSALLSSSSRKKNRYAPMPPTASKTELVKL